MYLDEQNTSWVIEWAKRYIKQRWSILINMEFNITHKPEEGQSPDFDKEFNEKPIDSEVAFTKDYHKPLLNMGPTPFKIITKFNEENYNEEDSNQEDSDKELSDIEVSKDFFKWQMNYFLI